MQPIAVHQESRSYTRLMRQLAGQPGGLILICADSVPLRRQMAQAVAASLERELYPVDLSKVVSEYIGETEKGLARVLARAEELDVILLIDEGDALFALRTDVRSANDRYANMETDYLLQRLEAASVFVVVAANPSAADLGRVRERLRAVIRPKLPGKPRPPAARG